MGRRKNPDTYEGDVVEVELQARWTKWDYRYVLEVFVAGKWRGAGYVMARKPRHLTMKDLKKVAKSVRINTGGKIAVIALFIVEDD